MYRLSVLFSLLITLTISAKTESHSDFNNSALEFISLEIDQFELEQNVFLELNDRTLNVEDIEVVELEEEVDINFDTAQYLPENFNVLAGKNNIDWSKIELIELEEEVELGFNTKDHLPENFNPYQGMDCKKNVVVSLY
jgi:hypothetical protein